MIAFRGMGAAHLVVGLILAGAHSMGIPTGSGDVVAIITSQLVGGVVMSAIGWRWRC